MIISECVTNFYNYQNLGSGYVGIYATIFPTRML